MTEHALASRSQFRDSRTIALLKATIPGLLISAAATSWCWWAAGPGLGLFLGAPLLACLYLPALVLGERGPMRLLALLASAAGMQLVLLFSIAQSGVSLGQWAGCALVALAWMWALAGLSMLLSRGGAPSAVAAGIVIFLSLAWLTWPVWLSHWMTQRMVNWLVPAHPLLAINSVLANLGSWDRMPLAYRSLTVLNQDISYRLPSTVFPAVAIHVTFGALGVLPAGLSSGVLRRFKNRR